MRIYAIRDRLIDYYMTPFCADSDGQVMSSLANKINDRSSLDAITQTPHHFELWRLGEVSEETGELTAHREFLADASSLVRSSVRSTGTPGTGEGTGAPGRSQGAPGATRGDSSADPGPAKGPAPATPTPAQGARPAPGGVPGH